MKAAKMVAWICLIAMTAGLINAFVNGDFFIDGGALFENPWGVMSIIDLYVGFALFSIWIVYREKTRWKMIIWVVTMMIFGFLTGSIYVLKALYESKGDWQVALHGLNRGANNGKT
ncbi:Protein of unknown function [Pelagirhabdus alkalitolerans]|uniref:DUF1475 domain-containing protein n=1 Tax=Pelagirhabdus alkalitolerans TaxID=1612202 RepID=A0A1G6M2P4_9BACI|nr:DUF1475 family protein [Pelagirhabdus alkalitolerans]SDC49783.1 Protein of unknown function [Pelagirhabdus alkalitolerans]